jgi:hypothetical protein
MLVSHHDQENQAHTKINVSVLMICERLHPLGAHKLGHTYRDLGWSA